MQPGIESELVTDDQRLAQLCEQWRSVKALALDTEFIRVSTFYPIAGVIQVGDGDAVYLLDPLELTQWQPFVELLQDPGILKLLHSGSEDLVLFQHFFNCLPAPLFDTQKAAAFLGYGFSISYLNLVRELVGIELVKAETRSDWLKRPLLEEQCIYAALDVAYLHAIHEQLAQRLAERDLEQPAAHEFARMLQVTERIEDQSQWPELYRHMGAAWRLNAQQLGALKLLSEWREREARKRDKPRPWVARDADLISIAEVRPASKDALKKIEGLSRNLYHQDADALLDLVRRSEPVPQAVVDGLDGQPLTLTQRPLLRRLQRGVRQVSERTGIAEELLARKKQLITLLRMNEGRARASLDWPEDIANWQQHLLHSELQPILADAGRDTP